MASNALIAFLAAVGSAGWVYAKAYRSSGGIVKSSAIAAAISGGLLFLVVLGTLQLLFS